ncbi:response regulator [Paraburkholderia unamae]|uniref:response regulator n=1 Tax=Paraburkholderia unamae TaxID=219649 RepID=UPI000DD2C4E0|nr:response regulator [Paraburkholderia unamae]
MKIAILEPDVGELDRTLQILSSAGHLCFGTRSDEGLRRLLEDVSIDLFLLDWSEPDRGRYETLRYLARREFVGPIVLFTSPQTACGVINSGLECGADVHVTKPLSEGESLAPLHALGNGPYYAARTAISQMM